LDRKVAAKHKVLYKGFLQNVAFSNPQNADSVGIFVCTNIDDLHFTKLK
jgi:hypothetical protein